MADGDLIGTRFELEATAIGFQAPPVALRGRIVRGGRGWSLFIVPAPGSAPGAIMDWLAPARPRRVDFGSHGVMRADFDSLPPAWTTAFEGVDVDVIRLTPDGRAEVSVLGSRAAIQRFAQRLAVGGDKIEVTEVKPAPEPRKLLTSPQEEALRVAVAAGYYRIPRPLNLHDLADRMGISAASLSERLRRAEARVLTKYIESGTVPHPEEAGAFDLEDLPRLGAEPREDRQGSE